MKTLRLWRLSMLRTRTVPVSARLAWAALVALLLALRTVAAAGYMPSVEHGRMTLMLCPDGEWTAPATTMPGMGGMGGDHAPKPVRHEQCPYAAAAAIPFAGGDSAPVLPLLAMAFALIALSTPPSIARKVRFERPYTTGPPIPA